jgi:hypothetical protein
MFPVSFISMKRKLTDPTPGGNGQWAIEDLTIPLPGIWAVEVNVLVSELEAVKLSGELAISK